MDPDDFSLRVPEQAIAVKDPFGDLDCTLCRMKALPNCKKKELELLLVLLDSSARYRKPTPIQLTEEWDR